MKLLLGLETLGEKFIPEVDFEIIFVKTIVKKMKNKETNVLPLGEKWIKEYFRNSNIAINKHF